MSVGGKFGDSKSMKMYVCGGLENKKKEEESERLNAGESKKSNCQNRN